MKYELGEIITKDVSKLKMRRNKLQISPFLKGFSKGNIAAKTV